MKTKKLKDKSWDSNPTATTRHSPLATRYTGSALVFVMVALLFLAGVGLTFVFWLSSESRQAGRRQAVTRDYYVAEAGTEKAILDVKSGAYIWTRGFSYTSSYILNGELVTVTITSVGGN